jgi:beta-galactosidase/beta-glucuronidase
LPTNSEQMAFIARNVGWYRKSFSLPSDWKDTTVSIYFEGIFHETTVWLNGKQVIVLHTSSCAMLAFDRLCSVK